MQFLSFSSFHIKSYFVLLSFAYGNISKCNFIRKNTLRFRVFRIRRISTSEKRKKKIDKLFALWNCTFIDWYVGERCETEMIRCKAWSSKPNKIFAHMVSYLYHHTTKWVTYSTVRIWMHDLLDGSCISLISQFLFIKINTLK